MSFKINSHCIVTAVTTSWLELVFGKLWLLIHSGWHWGFGLMTANLSQFLIESQKPSFYQMKGFLVVINGTAQWGLYLLVSWPRIGKSCQLLVSYGEGTVNEWGNFLTTIYLLPSQKHHWRILEGGTLFFKKIFTRKSC